MNPVADVTAISNGILIPFGVITLITFFITLYRFTATFQSKRTAERIRAEDEALRQERQTFLDQRLDRIDEDNKRIENVSKDTNQAVKSQNGRIGRLEQWRDDHERVSARGLEDIERLKQSITDSALALAKLALRAKVTQED